MGSAGPANGPAGPPDANVAVRAEPATIGTARARDQLALEVNLLGSLLGQTIAEQAGRDLLDLVERVRKATIRLRREDDTGERDALAATLAELDVERAEVVDSRLQPLLPADQPGRGARSRADGEARERSGRDSAAWETIAGAVAAIRGGPEAGRRGRSASASPAAVARTDEVQRLIGGLRITPVLTAHPTEARRRTLLLALRRVDRLLARLDDRDLPAAEDRDVRRRLREEITLLWRTADLRAVTPSPLDEVRTALAFFDETLFGAVPRLLRAADAALDEPLPATETGEAGDAGGSGTRPPRVPAFLRWASWIGGDRDGNPAVTAEVTERTLRIHADHVLRGYEAVATRLAQTVAASTPTHDVPRSLATRLARDAELLPELDRQLRRRYPDEPYRQRFGFIAERVRRTRAYLTGQQAPLTGRYEDAEELDAELAELQDALAADGLERVAWGEVQDLRWQLATFGFHLAALELRQHSAVHARALRALRTRPRLDQRGGPRRVGRRGRAKPSGRWRASRRSSARRPSSATS